MNKKACFGGTFDPIHNGHIAIAYEALNKLRLDKIVFIPAGNPPHKDIREVINAKVRYEMVQNAIKCESRFEIDNFEVLKENFSYTFETLKYLNEKERDTKWYFISGLDCLFNLETWKNVKKIFELCQLVVFNRPGFDMDAVLEKKAFLENKYGSSIIFLTKPVVDISSTHIREKIKKHQSVEEFLSKETLKFIEDNKLYV